MQKDRNRKIETLFWRHIIAINDPPYFLTFRKPF